MRSGEFCSKVPAAQRTLIDEQNVPYIEKSAIHLHSKSREAK